jgi:hypothetical protein
VIVAIILILILIEFALPEVTGKKPADEKDKQVEKAAEPEVPTQHFSEGYIPCIRVFPLLFHPPPP